MNRSLLVGSLLIFLAVLSNAQQPIPPIPPVDTLKEFKYQYKGEPFPYDSGVSTSDRQYTFMFNQFLLADMKAGIKESLKPVPKIVYVDKPVRMKGDGNKIVWLLIGLAGTALIGGVALSVR